MLTNSASEAVDQGFNRIEATVALKPVATLTHGFWRIKKKSHSKPVESLLGGDSRRFDDFKHHSSGSSRSLRFAAGSGSQTFRPFSKGELVGVLYLPAPALP